MTLTRRLLARTTALAAASGLIPAIARADTPSSTSTGYPIPLAQLPFGAHSHWLQPWRPLVRTRTAAQVARGVGIMLRNRDASQDALDMLRRCGIRHVRVEIGWGDVAFGAENRLNSQAQVGPLLQRLRRAGLRPLILLNAHHGYPAPARFTSTQTVLPAAQGARSIAVASTQGLVPGHSGLQGFGPMAAVMVTRIDGARLELSRPLPRAMPGGSQIQLATLAYEPFSEPGSARNAATVAGWLRYVDLIAQVVTGALGSEGTADRGFDFEVWNELTFGSNFLDINNYYDPPLAPPSGGRIFAELVRQTAAHVVAAGPRFAGVRLTDGFGSTLPWPASSLEPVAVSAISKHPYPPIKAFPEGEQHIVALDAAGQKTSFVPRYECYFSEYYGCAIQTETLCRDASDETSEIYGTRHGRMARVVTGQPASVDTWITELGTSTAELKVTDPAAAERLAVMACLRSLLFYLCIGVERVYLFEAFSEPGGFGLAQQGAPTVPTAPLLALRRVLDRIGGGYDGAVRPLSFTVASNSDAAVLFEGGGTPSTPPFRATDALAMLPVQTGPTTIGIVCYVVTRDMRVPLGPERIQVRIAGLDDWQASVEAYDPVADQALPIEVVQRDADALTVALHLSDMPALLLLK